MYGLYGLFRYIVSDPTYVKIHISAKRMKNLRWVKGLYFPHLEGLVIEVRFKADQYISRLIPSWIS